VKRCEGALDEPLRYMEKGASVNVVLGGSAYEVTSWGFWSCRVSVDGSAKGAGFTYAVDGHTLAVEPDGDLCALALLDAADTTHTRSMHAPVGGGDGFRQCRKSKGSANSLRGRHGVGQACAGRFVEVCVGPLLVCAQCSRRRLGKRFGDGAEKGGQECASS
jgi:hypothetical protein